MILVSGNPRSGTSMMMGAIRAMVGEDRLLANQWAARQDVRPEDVKDYVRDLNPDGFWECKYTVRGIRDEVPEEHKDKVCKVVSSGLFWSQPKDVDLVVYMERHPWASANSSANLLRNTSTGLTRGDVGGVDPKTWAMWARYAAEWIIKNDIPVVVVAYEEVVMNPIETLRPVGAAIGVGSAEIRAAAATVKLKLKRSEARRLTVHPIWDVSEEIHEKILARDWQGVVRLYDEYEQSMQECGVAVL